MGKKTILMVLCIVLASALVPLGMVFAEAPEIPASIDAPQQVAITATAESGTVYSYDIGYSNPANFRSFGIDKDAWYDANLMANLTVAMEFDYKVNSGMWHDAADDWKYEDSAPEPFNWISLADPGSEGETAYITADWLTTLTPGIDQESFLVNNTLYFRIRYLVAYIDHQASTVRMRSPWSEVVAIGKDAGKEEIVVDPPVLTKAELKTDEHGAPYVEISNDVSDSVWTLHNGPGDVDVQVFLRTNEGAWQAQTGFAHLGDVFHVTPASLGVSGAMDVETNKYEIRARHRYWEGSTVAWSVESNLVEIELAPWSDAHDWAVDELQQANEAGLIPEILQGADLTMAINREEFCELALLLYEKLTGITPAPVSPNPFTDTSNPQILKAFALEITTGTSATTFTPKRLIIRQECAAMLFRTIQAYGLHGGIPKTDSRYSIAGVPDFPDQQYIDAYAVQATKYMSRLGIVKGDQYGNFMPKAVTPADEAIGYGMATREAAILMSVRTYDKLK